MTRSLSLVLSFGFLALAACSGASGDVGPQPEKDEDASEPAAKKSGSSSNDGSSSQASTPAPAPSSSSSSPPASPAPPASATCAASADALACVECCVKDLPTIDQKTCTCDATAACKTECAGNLCDGKIPSFQCGQCLVQNAAKVQACVEGIVAAPKKCVQDAQCLAKPGAEAVKNLPLPFSL